MAAASRRKLERVATSDYTTAESSTLDDFNCQICLGTLKDCVALEPCGHNWCATCLSHHFASLLQVQPIKVAQCSACPDNLTRLGCLGILKNCVALEPCSHNWYATCLSHHCASC